MAEQSKLNVTTVINESPIGGFQILVFTICLLVVMCDGHDTQALAYVAPSLAHEWKLSPATFGPVFATVLLGSMAGAMLLGYLGDRFGRQTALLFRVIGF